MLRPHRVRIAPRALLAAGALAALLVACDLGGVAPPRGRVLAREGDAWRVRIVPAEATGRVLVLGAGGAALGAFPVPARPAAPQRILEVTLPGLARGDTVFLVHELPSGARSRPRPLRILPTPRPGELDHVP